MYVLYRRAVPAGVYLWQPEPQPGALQPHLDHGLLLPHHRLQAQVQTIQGERRHCKVLKSIFVLSYRNNHKMYLPTTSSFSNLTNNLIILAAAKIKLQFYQNS